MSHKTQILDETVKKKYELKYLIVQSADKRGERIIFPLLYFVGFIVLFVMFTSAVMSQFYVFVMVSFFLSALIFSIAIIPKINKGLRSRKVVGFVRFFPHYMTIEQDDVRTDLPYHQVHRIVYANNLVDDYFGKGPNVITRRYKIVCKDKRVFFFECECFIRANKTDRKEKILPDVGYVIKRILPPGGIIQNNKEIRKMLKSK